MSGSHHRGRVFDIQRYSLHDGPGLRTNIFLKGCPLHCPWCANPEGRRRRPDIAFFSNACFLCGDCVAACPMGAIRLTAEEGLRWERLQCDKCGQCVQVCAAGAFRTIGEEKTAAEVVAEALRDRAFYGGDGGLTLTGGEPTLQPAFAQEVLRRAREEGLHTAMETCGYGPWSRFAPLLPYLDLVLYDIKHADAEQHRSYVGVSNELILENARRIARARVPMVIRVPLIPHFNTDEQSLRAIAQFVLTLDGVREVHLLPYHTLGRAKYEALGEAYPMGDLPPMKPEEAEPLANIVREHGLHVVIGG